MQFWEKFALTTIQIALNFALCNFSYSVQFFPKSHSRPCDYLYKFVSLFIIILKLCITLVALSKKLSEISNFPLKVPFVRKGLSNDG